jgi:hypothetical protein
MGVMSMGVFASFANSLFVCIRECSENLVIGHTALGRDGERAERAIRPDHPNSDDVENYQGKLGHKPKRSRSIWHRSIHEPSDRAQIAERTVLL